MEDSENDGDQGDGLVVNLSPKQLCFFVNNETMNGISSKGGINVGKNDNKISPATIRATAEAFREGIKPGTSTTMVICPACPGTGNPKLWVKAYRDAEKHAQGQSQVRVCLTQQ